MAQRRRKSRNCRPVQVPPAKPDEAPLTAVERRARRLARDEAAAARPGARIEPTPEQLRNGDYSIVRTKDPDTAAPIEVRRNMAGNGSAVDRWHARGQLDDRQADACRRYRADYDRGGFQRSLISRYDGGGGSGDGSPNMAGLLAGTVAQLDARRRVVEARKMVPRCVVDYFDDAVLHDFATAAIAERAGRPGQNGQRVILCYIEISANMLADFYKIPG